ncbi:hypothetical protein P8452_01298 [Trifolium repens]|nr:hypothetical protein P8452_01298 [Trifolium repens]
MSRNIDLESGKKSLSLKMHKNPQLRWSFIHKVYSIITFQFLLTIGFASIVIFVRPVANFFKNTTHGDVLYIVLIFVPFIALFLHSYYDEKHPLNYFFLLIFNVSSALCVGLTCAFARTIILEVFVLTTGIVFSITLYTFWAAKRNFVSIEKVAT